MTRLHQHFNLHLSSLCALPLLIAVGCGDSPTESVPQPPTAAPVFSLSTIEVPNARSTTVFGINNKGELVGNFVDATGVSRGFLLRSGTFTTIDHPGAGRTAARGINDAGDVVGNWARAGDAGVISFGFRRTADGQFQPVTFAGFKHTIPQRILGDGTVIGCAHQDDLMASMIGITVGPRGTSQTALFASMHNGATPDLKRIVGLYTKMPEDRGEGYLLENNVPTPLVVAGSMMTAGWDINPRSESVGVFQNAAGVHGFIHATTYGFITIDYPGATATRAFGINSTGDVVGSYVSGGVTRGFLARRTS